MRFGNWRGVTLALGCLLALSLSPASARADGFHTIPSLVPAVDLNTGQPYYAPPIPYGHYAGKNHGGKIMGRVHGLFGGLKHGCGACGGKGCGLCGGKGLFHGGGGGACGDPGCDDCGGGSGVGHGGLFGKHKGSGGCGLCGGKGCGSCVGHSSTTVTPSGQEVVMPAPQGSPVCASDPCGDPGCRLFGKHHKRNAGCGNGDPCGGCGGKGCGLCGGKGGLCGGCGGAGCGLCGKGKGLAHGLVAKALGHDKIKWFVGPGGPVPLTPGYVPYVNPVRAPRDFLAFPPFTP